MSDWRPIETAPPPNPGALPSAESPSPIVIARPGNVHCPHCGGRLGEITLDPKLFHSGGGAAVERARIRKELLEAFDDGEIVWFKDLRAALDRICPEEE